MDDKTSNVSLGVQMTSVINYALQQNRIPIIQEIVIQNNTPQSLQDTVLKIWSEPEITAAFEQNIDLVPATAAFSIKSIPLRANGEFLAGLTERISGIVHITLTHSTGELAHTTYEVMALAFDEWQGTIFFPELLAAFVTPNHPEIIKINAHAAELLGKWTGDPSLDAYQTQNPNRVLMQAAAIYGALQAQNIVYSVPPASFEAVGQRVRLCDAVIQQKMGTCLDLTLFYAACLEAAGLHPLLLLQKGHIFTGVWLEDLSFSEAVLDDPALITKRLADGIREIAVMECTALVSSKNVNFDGAKAAAESELNGTDTLEYIIDVGRARLSGIRPLPIRIQNESGWKVEKEQRADIEITDAPLAMGKTIKVVEGKVAETSGKLVQWERKLLDLSLRNTLINMRWSQSVIPVLSSSLGDLEDALADGSEYGIGPHPSEWQMKEDAEKSFESLTDLGALKALIRSEFQNKRLRSALNEGELSRAVVNLYRSSKVSLEENGANTLYLALGLLRWYETKSSQKPRYAPIVLLPIEIVRKSAIRGYVIRLRDEEPQMNITLLEMLKQDFGITISGFDPLPLDEHGIDMLSVFTILRKAVMDQNRWDVIESAFLGIFSFSQFVMWNDMHNRMEDLKKNKIVSSLINNKLSWNAEPMEIGIRVPEDGVLLPIPADASQLYAIEAAARGESFVLHGPPGTGKSQTITALIVNALAQGKTVLFVAEKMAALSVVQKRLNALGIGPFCLELHSNKSKKRDVLDQLRVATEVTRLQPAGIFQKKAEQTAELRKELDAYAEALHKKQRSGLSLFEMISGFENHRESSDSVSFPDRFGTSADANLLEQQKILVERLIASARSVGHPCNHPLRYVSRTVYSQQIRAGLPDIIFQYQSALDLLERAGARLVEGLCTTIPASLRDWDKFHAISSELERWFPMPRAWAKYDDMLHAMQEIQEMAQHHMTAADIFRKLSSDWTAEFFSQNGAELTAQWKTACAEWFLPKMIGQNKLAKAVVQFSKSKVQKAVLLDAFTLLAQFQSERTEAKKLFTQYGNDLGKLYCDKTTDWTRIASFAEVAKQSAIILDELTGNDEFRKAFAALLELFPAIKEMNEAWQGVPASKTALYDLLEIRFEEENGTPWLRAQQNMCREITDHAMELKEWMVWKNACNEAINYGLEPLVKVYESGLKHEDVPGAYYKGLYVALINEAVEHDAVLNTFSGAVFNEKIRQFKRLDQELTELVKTEVFCRLAAMVPNFTREAAHSSEVGILQRAIRSGGRGISIRKLFEQIPGLLPRLCPCMLMSPISAAQYLDPKRTPFDIVVFDEASQMTTCKAVGALARGENAIIVGDPKQMPPTSFFSSNMIDEENIESEDLESILDDCLALNMPQTHLLWHYRSRYESLIAFSNNQFYENKLYTFPSVNDRESRVSFTLVQGCFDRGKTRQNRAEAEAVVSELIRRCHDPLLSGQSVGVVTFNISQQNLIDDLFTEACKTDAALETWATNAEEPLLIKNLENVQGDERDVILFSVGYGPDAEGKVYMNFGPLNREGGWRRLNVAVSRARHEMMVFSTLAPDQIDLSRTAAKGVAALKAFLEYAGGAELSESNETVCGERVLDSSIAVSICTELANRGYAAQQMVGHSEYRIDIGVIDPKDPNRYLLGILLDGFTYGSSKTTRDRELAQISVLNGLGWEIHRIWAVDWWDNRYKELDHLFVHLAKAEKQPTKATEKPTQKNVAPDISVQPMSSSRLSAMYKAETAAPVLAIKTYQVAALPTCNIPPEEYLYPQKTKQIQNAVLKVLNSEAPISEGLLVRHVLQSFGIARAGSRIQTRTDEILTRMQLQFTVQDGQKFYWADTQNPNTYADFRATGEGDNKRDAKDLPVQEAANAALAVLKEQIGLPKEDLIRETAKLLGYSRSGNIVVSILSEGIQYAIAHGKIYENQMGYLTPKT